MNTESLKDSRDGASVAIRQADLFLANGEGEEMQNEETSRAQQKALGSTL